MVTSSRSEVSRPWIVRSKHWNAIQIFYRTVRTTVRLSSRADLGSGRLVVQPWGIYCWDFMNVPYHFYRKTTGLYTNVLEEHLSSMVKDSCPWKSFHGGDEWIAVLNKMAIQSPVPTKKTQYSQHFYGGRRNQSWPLITVVFWPDWELERAWPLCIHLPRALQITCNMKWLPAMLLYDCTLSACT
jgi:hypothetical protein